MYPEPSIRTILSDLEGQKTESETMKECLHPSETFLWWSMDDYS